MLADPSDRKGMDQTNVPPSLENRINPFYAMLHPFVFGEASTTRQPTIQLPEGGSCHILWNADRQPLTDIMGLLDAPMRT
jgi:hypothetical protein